MRTETRLFVWALFIVLAAAARADYPPIGLSEVGVQWFDNDNLLFYTPENDDHFAWAIAAGDFNGDGADDLASGIPDDDEIGGGCTNCGMVLVRWGVPGSGLAPGPVTTVLHQGLASSPDPPEERDRFGAALAAGDFNGDGFDDLAVGVPGDTLEQPGGVQVYFGWSDGFQIEFAEYLTEAEAGEGEHVCTRPKFGVSLAVGNFDHDPFDDLAIGVPDGCEYIGEDWIRSGSVYVAHGQPWGLLPWWGYRISQDEVEMQDVSEAGDQFGRAVAAGDFDSIDGYDDLAIGVPGENDYGLVQTLFGSPNGLLFWTNIVWLPGALGQEPEPGDRLGRTLVAGDFDGDLYDDLAVGDPNEDLGDDNERIDVGVISVAFGSSSGFELSRTLRFDQGSLYGHPDWNQAWDYFGLTLAAGDFDGDGRDDLAVGHPGDNGPPGDAGAVTVLMGAFGNGLGTRSRWLRTGRHVGSPGTELEFAL